MRIVALPRKLLIRKVSEARVKSGEKVRIVALPRKLLIRKASEASDKSGEKVRIVALPHQQPQPTRNAPPEGGAFLRKSLSKDDFHIGLGL